MSSLASSIFNSHSTITSTSTLTSTPTPASITNIDSFNLFKYTPRHNKFPKNIKITVWNCRGIHNKVLSTEALLSESDADILVLNETFRPSNTPWPSTLPPCLAEATSANPSPTHVPNGVAVIANRRAIARNGAIRSFSILEVDNINGTKVIMKINQFILMAIYAPPSMGIECLQQFLTQANDLARDGTPVVLCGDFNAIHSHTLVSPSDSTARRRHQIFTELIQPSFYRVDTGSSPTRPANRRDATNTIGTVIDHILVANADALDGKCMNSFAHSSDHHPICARILLRHRPDDDSIKYWRLKLERLKESDTLEEYTRRINFATPTLLDQIRSRLSDGINRLSPNGVKQSVVDALELDFVSTVVNIAASVLGRKAVPLVKNGGGKRLTTPQEYAQARSDLETILDQSPQASDDTIDELRDRLNTLDRRTQNNSYMEWKEEFSRLPVTQRTKVINRLLRRRSAAGACLASTTIALDSYRAHFAGQFTNTFDIEPFQETSVPIDQTTEIGLAAQTFPLETVTHAILRSPAGKAPGLSGLSAELLHPVAHFLAPVLSRLFCVYMSLSMVPTSWKRALMCPVPKKGDLSRISNYRPISLTELTRKLFEMCILKRLGSEISLSREQGGFRGNRSTLDQVECLDKLIKEIRGTDRHKKKVFMAFLDIKAAYDSVPRAELWRQCQDLGVDHLTLSTLRSLFDHNSSQLVVAQKRSKPFPLPAGVLQGSVLSPLLYSIYLDPLVEKLRTMGSRIRLPLKPVSEGINALMYADDIALIANSSRNLKRILELAEEDSIDRGYRFSPTKCVVVSQDNTRYRLYGTDLTKENSFCYLGVDINCLGICESAHVKRRIEKAEKMAGSLNRVGARFRNFPAYINLQAYRVFIRPGLEYGLSLLVAAAAVEALHQCQKRIICDFLGVHNNARNDVVEGISSCPSILVRQHLLSRKRAVKQRTLWNSINRNEYALFHVIEGLFGQAHTFGATFNLDKTQEETRRDLYVIPTLSSLASRSGGYLTIAVLRWLLFLKQGHGIFRTLLLWTLWRWRKFKGAHSCLLCHCHFKEQDHIASCAGLRARLTECRLIDFNSLTYSNSAMVEHALLLVSQEFIMNPSEAAKVLQFIVESILACLKDTLGENREY